MRVCCRGVLAKVVLLQNYHQFHKSSKIIIIDKIKAYLHSSKKVISFPTPVINFLKNYDTSHFCDSSHISNSVVREDLSISFWPIIFYSWYILPKISLRYALYMNVIYRKYIWGTLEIYLIYLILSEIYLK